MPMIMRCLLALVLLWGMPAAAQEAADADREVLAERYIQLAVGDNLSKSIEAYVAELLAADASADPDQTEWAEQNLPGLMLAMIDDLMGQLAPIYAEVMTQEELEALIVFYETPIGREVARKTVTLSIQTEPLLQAAVERYMEEFLTKYCARFSCPTGDMGVSNPK